MRRKPPAWRNVWWHVHLSDDDRGIAIVSAPDGTVARIVRGELGLPVPVPLGTTLVGLMEEGSREKARNFLAAVNERQAAFDWQMTMNVAGRPTPMHFAATAHDGLLFIVAARSGPGLVRVSEELSSINNEQTNALRAALKDLSLQDDRRQVRDRDLYDDLSRLNNELTNLEREMVKKNVELEKLNEQKNRVLGMAAHDLRSPLGIIHSYSEFLEDEAGDVLNAEQREFVAVIKATSEFMLQMVTDILDVTAIEAGRLRLALKPTDLAALVTHNVTLNRVLASRKGIAVVLDEVPPLPTIALDGGKIDQVLNNLIGNAVKFSHRDSTVRVHLSLTPAFVTVAIEDRGQGIPAAERSHLFTPFGTASVRGTGGEQSTGLGLAIARNIVEGHGGRIWLESEVGHGSTFFFTLPHGPELLDG
jgi:signal transduction histidine kinase